MVWRGGSPNSFEPAANFLGRGPFLTLLLALPYGEGLYSHKTPLILTPAIGRVPQEVLSAQTPSNFLIPKIPQPLNRAAMVETL